MDVMLPGALLDYLRELLPLSPKKFDRKRRSVSGMNAP
jgi:hypothetical protein